MSGHGNAEAGREAPPLPPLVDHLVRFGGLISGSLILVALIVTTANVVGRYALGNPFRGAEELTGYLVVATVMTGAAEAYRRGDHIAIDFIRGVALAPVRAASRILFDASVLLFAAIIGWSGWHSVQFSRSFGSYSPGYLETPMWIPQSAMLVGAILLCLAAAGRLYQTIARGLHA